MTHPPWSRGAALLFAIALLPWAALGEVLPPQDTNNGSAAGDGILETMPGADWVIEPGDDLTYSDTVISLHSGLNILPQGRLTLDHVKLIANISTIVISVQSDAVLILRNFSMVAAGPWQGGAALGFWNLSMRVEPFGTLIAEDTDFYNIGKFTPSVRDAGLYVASSNVSFRNVTINNGRNGLVLNNATNVRAANLSVTSNSDFDLLLLGNSTLELAGGSYTTTNLSANSQVNLSYFVDMELDDTTGKPLANLDYRIVSAGSVVTATSAFGGSDRRSQVDGLHRHLPRWVEVPAGLVAGALPPLRPSILLHAAYGEWSENRTLLLLANTHFVFVKTLSATAMVDVAPAMGVSDPTHVFTNNSLGPGAAWGDYDRDGWLDLYVTGAGTTNGGPLDPDNDHQSAANHLYRNNAGAGFTDVTNLLGVGYSGSFGVTFVDYDGDGWPDIYLANYGWGGTLDSPGEANVLLRNNGNNSFTNVTSQAAVGDPGHSVGSAWADYDRDGDLDLYVVNQGIVLNGKMRNETNALYRNDGDGTFTNVTAQAGDLVGGAFGGWGLGLAQNLVDLSGSGTVGDVSRDGANGSGVSSSALWFDYNNDGWQDLLVGNRYGVSPLYRNNGDGTFAEVTAAVGLSRVGSAMGLDAHDLDGNGWLDIVQTNEGRTFLWMNDNGTFVDQASARGVDGDSGGEGVGFVDLDNDGDFDLFEANSVFASPALRSPEVYYRNTGDGTFVDVSADAAMNGSGLSLRAAGAAFGDFNRDGCVDIYLANADGPNQLLSNECAWDKAWLGVRLTGTVSNRDGVGARVYVSTASGSVQWDEVVGGGSYASGNSLELHFGLGAVSRADNLTVRWPSGKTQTLVNVSVNQTIRIAEPAQVLVTVVGNLTIDEDRPATLTAAIVSSEDPDFERHAVYEWSLGSGSNLTYLSGKSVNFTVFDMGVWKGLLTAYDPAGGAAGQVTFDLTVADRTAPSVKILAPVQGAHIGFGQNVTFAGAASDNDPAFSSTANYTWRISRAGAPEIVAYGPLVTLAFDEPGSYVANLTVNDAAGNNATRSVTFTFPLVVCDGCGEPVLLYLILAGLTVAFAVIAATYFVSRRYYKK